MSFLLCCDCGKITKNSECCDARRMLVSIVLPTRLINTDKRSEALWLFSQIHLPGVNVIVRFSSEEPTAKIRCPDKLRETVRSQVDDYLDIAAGRPFKIPTAARESYSNYTDHQFRVVVTVARRCKHSLNVAWLNCDEDIPRDLFHFAAVNNVLKRERFHTVDDACQGVRSMLADRLS